MKMVALILYKNNIQQEIANQLNVRDLQEVR